MTQLERLKLVRQCNKIRTFVCADRKLLSVSHMRAALQQGYVLQRRAFSTLGARVAEHAAATPSATAVLAPQQSIQWTYSDLDTKAGSLATGLADVGYSSGDILVTDLPNTVENLVLQVHLFQSCRCH